MTQQLPRGTTKAGKRLYYLVLMLLLASIALPVLARFQADLLAPQYQVPFLRYSGRIRGNVILHILLFAGALVFHGRLKQLASDLLSWLGTAPHRREKRIVVAVITMIAIVWLFKLHIVFMHRGNPGWDYRSRDSLMSSARPALDETVPVREFHKLAIVEDGLPYMRSTGYIVGTAFFLHFVDGQVLPAGTGLLQNTWPDRIFGNRYDKHREELVDLVVQGLGKRRSGVRGLLPERFSLPNHIEARRIDYSDYPPPEMLRSLSIWQLLVHVEAGRAAVVAARLISEVEIDQ